jgi:hypothetical protein
MHFLAIREGFRRFQVAAVAGSAVSILLAGPAVAGDTITVSPATVHAGDTVVITGQVPTVGRASCPAEDQATLASTVRLFPSMRAPRTAGGSFRVHFRVPRFARAGFYRIGARCRGHGLSTHAILRVVTTRVFPSDPKVRPVTQPALANGDRRGVTAGTLLIGMFVFLAVAEWKPWQRRRR